eukprot:scaffold3969_cov363-Prasinococcus_capsulatus_cf.AAC.3
MPGHADHRLPAQQPVRQGSQVQGGDDGDAAEAGAAGRQHAALGPRQVPSCGPIRIRRDVTSAKSPHVVGRLVKRHSHACSRYPLGLPRSLQRAIRARAADRARSASCHRDALRASQCVTVMVTRVPSAAGGAACGDCRRWLVVVSLHITERCRSSEQSSECTARVGATCA